MNKRAWGRLLVFAVVLAAGLVILAGVGLFVAPQPRRQTRHRFGFTGPTHSDRATGLPVREIAIVTEAEDSVL